MHALILIAILAAPGDPQWTAEEATVTLNGSQKSALASTVTAIWPAIAPLGVRDLHCVRDPATRCRPIELRTGTITDYDNAELSAPAGGFVRFVSESGGVVSWLWSPGYESIAGASQTALASWAALVWPAVPLGQVTRLRIIVGASKVTTGDIVWITGGTRAQYLAALKAGKVKARNGSE